MRVFGKCNNCNHEIGFRTFDNTQVDFAKNNGEFKTIACENCGSENKFHVDELFAKESKFAHIVALLIFIIGTPLTFFILNPILISERNHYMIYFIGGFMLVPVVAFRIIKRQDQTRVSSFNRIKLKPRKK